MNEYQFLKAIQDIKQIKLTENEKSEMLSRIRRGERRLSAKPIESPIYEGRWWIFSNMGILTMFVALFVLVGIAEGLSNHKTSSEPKIDAMKAVISATSTRF